LLVVVQEVLLMLLFLLLALQEVLLQLRVREVVMRERETDQAKCRGR
jgi:hypothetical protein